MNLNVRTLSVSHSGLDGRERALQAFKKKLNALEEGLRRFHGELRDALIQLSQLRAADFETANEPEIVTLAEAKRRHIVFVVEHFKGNKTKAAKALKVNIKTLYNLTNDTRSETRSTSRFGRQR